MDRERQLARRQDAIDKQADELRKQEKVVEAHQRRLTEKIERQDTRNAELEKIYEDQKKVLHEISGLSKEEATQKLLAGLETELHDQASIIKA